MTLQRFVELSPWESPDRGNARFDSLATLLHQWLFGGIYLIVDDYQSLIIANIKFTNVIVKFERLTCSRLEQFGKLSWSNVALEVIRLDALERLTCSRLEPNLE